MLGPLEIVVDGRPVDFPSGKARLLLAALVVRANEVVSADRLFEVLWGAQPPESAANTLQTYVAHLRTGLEPDRARRKAGQVLVTRQPGYMLVIEPGAIDAVRFERLAEQGRRELATAPADAARTLRAALALWRGEALSDFTYEPFTQADISRLTELRFAALEDRIGADLSLGEHHAVVGELAQLVSEHPFRERLAGQFMVALYRDGRQADALRAYRRLRDTLVEQLGIEPNPTVARLEQAILEQRPDLDWSPLEAARIPAAVPARPAPGVSGEQAAARGRAAAAERRWQDALECLSAADRDGALCGDDLDALADALLWTGIALGGDDLATARSAVSELAGLADVFASPAIRAAADTAQGAVLLADGDAAGAVECLSRSADLWRDANAPYERARARMLLARALHARGERSRAQGGLQAARSAFESLGAGLDLGRLAAFDTAVADRG